jgi:hypothetical protein
MSKFKVGDLVRCINSRESYTNLDAGAVYTVTDSGVDMMGVDTVSVDTKHYHNWYASRFELVPQHLVNMTKDVDSHIPASVAEYIEHLELREEALEQLVSDLSKQLKLMSLIKTIPFTIEGRRV